MSKTLFVSLMAGVLWAEVHTITLREAAERALRESPEALVSRLDEQRAQQQIRVAKDPFVPKVYAGSGLAYSNGFPMSIDGAAPSVVQAKSVASGYKRQQRFQLAQAKEEARGVAIEGQTRREDAVGKTIELFLDAESKGRLVEMVRKQVDTARKLDALVRVRVEEGREIPLEGKKTALEVAKAEQRIAALAADRDYVEGWVAMVLGFPAGDRVRPAMEERGAISLPVSEQEAIAQAVADSREVRRLESAILARGLEAQAKRAARYPVVDLVAQYGLFAKYNHFEDYFKAFQRHNGQLGVSIQIPLMFGPAVDALTAQVEGESARLRIEMNQTRSRITLETQRRFQDYQKAELGRQVSRMDLEVARETLSVELVRLEEGRVSMKQVEEARLREQEKWIAYYDSQQRLEKARYALLGRTGGLLAALR